jgi:Mg2+-importing ATPase
MTHTSSQAFWNIPIADLLTSLDTQREGLTGERAKKKQDSLKKIRIQANPKASNLKLLLSQFKSPIILILLTASILSFFLRDPFDSLIILIIVLGSGILSFWQEMGAAKVMQELLYTIHLKTSVLRDGQPEEIFLDEVVPGDIVILNAGDSIPGDGVILKSKELFLNEAALTGESYPIEKKAGISSAASTLAQRHNALFMGSHVVSGTGQMLVVRIGKQTEFGRIADRLKSRAPETDFERGIRRFGNMFLEITLLLVIGIFACNVALQRHVLDSLLFALALAVGLTPQLLPAVIGVNLSRGARRMARKKVVVKKLAAIENFGSMNILCSDKTGTLTEGVVALDQTLDSSGHSSEQVARLAYLNAYFQNGFTNPIDEAIRRHHGFDLTGISKLDEEPYDFSRKRLSVLIQQDQQRFVITKGAFPSILQVCRWVEIENGKQRELDEKHRSILETSYQDWSQQGYRVLGLSIRELNQANAITKEDEKDMIFIGFLLLRDPLKPDANEAIIRLNEMGIGLKVISGDNRWVAYQIMQTLANRIDDRKPRMLTGLELDAMSDEALTRRVNEVDLFSETEPRHKERIILSLKKAGHVVGYLGDGINDATALRAADVGVSVDQAVDVAKEAADIVLLNKNLAVLADGVREGRVTFANTLKYIFMATSANFGNMFSMAGASLFLPFLPLLPKQILLMNFLTDLPEMTIAADSVDPELIEKPQRWDIHFIRRYMIVFGLISSFFDYLTFGFLLIILKSNRIEFQSGWFIESVASAAAIVLVLRTRRPAWRSKPTLLLLLATGATIFVALILPYTALGHFFGFTPLPFIFLASLILILFLYGALVEYTKKIFYQFYTIN